jgi:hypothetical protein
VSYRDDMNALYARTESLERDLERAQEEIARLRGEAEAAPSQRRLQRDGRKFMAGELRSVVPPPPPPPNAEGVLAMLDSMAAAHDPPPLRALHEYEDAIARAVELLMPELIARRRGVRGDGSEQELLWLLDLLNVLWHEHAADKPPALVELWRQAAGLARGWAPHNELARALLQIAAYYLPR